MLSNSTKVWVFIISCCFLFLFLGYHLGGRWGLLIGLLLAIFVNILIFFYGENHILNMMPVRKVRGQDSWGIRPLLDSFSQQLGMPRSPNLYILESTSAVAFCLGIAWRRPCVCLSEGLLQRFNAEEIKAVVAHQVCQIRRLDTFGFGVASIIANSLMGLGQILDHFWPPNFFFAKKQRPFLTLLSPLGWLIIKLMIRRSTYFENDQLSSDLLGNRRTLAEVLWKLDGFSRTMPLTIPPCTSHLFVVNPEAYTQKNIFLRSHPSIRSRLLKLMGYYPI